MARPWMLLTGPIGEPGKGDFATLRQPVRHEVVTHVSGTFRYRCLRAVQAKCWSEWQDLNLRPPRPERGALPELKALQLH